MDKKVTNEKQKVTLTELQRYLPFPPPSWSPQMPQQIKKYLGSSSFNNYSLKEQSIIRYKYTIAYRNYFSLNLIVQHLSRLTNSKFTKQSFEQALCNCAQRYNLIDWYLFVRIIKRSSKIRQAKDKNEATNFIIFHFRKHLQKKRIIKGIQQVQIIKLGLEERLVKQFGKQILGEVKDLFERNRFQMQQKLKNSELNGKINYIQFQQLLNQILQCAIDPKKIKYLYLRYDYKNVGYFDIDKFINQTFTERKIISVTRPNKYLANAQEILEFARSYLVQTYYSVQQMVTDYKEKYHRKSIQDHEQDQLHPYELYLFFKDKCENKLSFMQASFVHSNIKFVSQLSNLYNKPNFMDLSFLLQKLITKKQRRKQLKKQNQVFYSFRRILLYLLSRCKSNKLTRAQFTQTMVAYDHTLKYDAFFCVWRVYGNLINIERMKKECNLNILACHFRLTKSDDQYEYIIDRLMDEFPSSTQVPYMKVEQKINLNCQFVLDNYQIKPLPLADYDTVDYRKTIALILPMDVDLKIRAYIFRKNSQKFIVLWRGIRAKKQRQKLQQNLLKLLVKQTIDKPKQQPKKNIKKNTTHSKSVVSAERVKKQMNLESLQLVSSILMDILDDLKVKDGFFSSFQLAEYCIKKELVLTCKEMYTYRSIITRCCFHPLLGCIALGKQFLILKDGKMQKLDIKIPFKPDIEILDFVVWNNCLVVFTSYNTLELYALGQNNNYPFRSVQLPLLSDRVSVKFYEVICSQHFHGKYPILLKPFASQLLVNLLNTQEIFIVPEDPTLPTNSIKLTFKEHFYPNILIKWLQALKKVPNNSEDNAFVENLMSLLQKFGNEQNVAQLQIKLFESLPQKLKEVSQDMTLFDIKQLLNFFKKVSSGVLRTLLKRECGLKEMPLIPRQLKEIIKLVVEFMKQGNYSLHEMIQQITLSEEEVGLKQFKNYLLRVAYQQLLQFQKEIDKFLNSLMKNKRIQYCHLASIIGQNWPYSLLEKPYFLINDYIYLVQHGLLIYTINSQNTIFIKDIKTNKLIAKLLGHNSPPVIHYISTALILISADTIKSKDLTVDIRVWRLEEDLIAKYSQRPPWNIQAFGVIKNCHEQAVTSISYLPHSHTVITTSLDSTIKIWQIQYKLFTFKEIKRVYSSEHLFLSAHIFTIRLLRNEIGIQFLLSTKINKQISQNNVYKYQTTAQLHLVEHIKIKTDKNCQFYDTPLRMKQYMQKQGQSNSFRKKALLAKVNYNEIKHLNRASLMLESLDRNIYNSLKSAYIFDSFRELKALTNFLSKNSHAQVVVRKVCEQYGLDLITEQQLSETSLQFPPQLLGNDTLIRSSFENIILPDESVQEILEKVYRQSSNNKTLIEQDTLIKIVTPYLYGDNQSKFKQILKNNQEESEIKRSPSKNESYSPSKSQVVKQNRPVRLIEIQKIKHIIKGYEIKSQISKFYSSMRSLLIFLYQHRIQPWELFSITRKELQRSRKIRTIEFTQRLTHMKFNQIKLNNIINYLNRSGSLSLFEFLHYAKMAKEELSPSQLSPNYSSVIMSQSQVQVNQNNFSKELKRMKDSQLVNSVSKSSLQLQIQDMMMRKSSKISQVISQAEERSKDNSVQKMRKINQEQDSRGMVNSNSRGSLSKDITYTKDSLKKESINIMRKLKQLLKNEGKSMWQIIALAVPDFISEPIISEAEYLSMFDYLKTPFRLQEKLKLLQYVRRQAGGLIDINILFELTQASHKQKLQGDKYIVTYLVEKLQEVNEGIDQAIELVFFQKKDEAELDEIILAISKPPFNCSHFALKEFQHMLLQQKKIKFSPTDIHLLIVSVIERHRLKIELNKINFLADLLFKIEKRGQTLLQIFPKCDKVNLAYFTEHAKNIHPEDTNFEHDFRSILYSISKKNSKKDFLPQSISWNDFIRQLQTRMGQLSEQSNKQLEVCRKLLKQLQMLKLTIFQFFLSVDRSKKFFITQQQLQIGLSELNIDYDLWSNIPKKNSKRLHFLEFVLYLQGKNILPYKSVDSELEIAMDKFTRRFMRHDDIQFVFQRLKGDAQSSEIKFDNFKRALKINPIFKQEEIVYLFGLFAREGVVHNSKFGNDELLKDPANLSLTFGYKKFVDIVGLYRAENITKTAHYRFYDYLKKRNVSLVFQYRKWLEKNKKLKEVSEALKKDSTTLPKNTFILFLNEIKGGLNQKQINELVARPKEEIDFQVFLSQLEDIYKRGNMNLQKQEAQFYLQQIVKRVVSLNVALQRLFQDYSHQNKLNITQFNDLCLFIQLGLNKIQIKRVFGYLDKQKKGVISWNQLLEAVESAQMILQRDQQDYQFDYIIEKLMNNPSKYVLKNSKIGFNEQRARIIFESILSQKQVQLLYNQCLKELKKQSMTQKQLEEYLQRKIFELRLRCDKKDKDLIIRILNYFKKINVDIQEIFSYFSMHSPREELKKQEFVLLLQTLQVRCNLSDINSLFIYLDEGRRGIILRGKWEEKLNMIYLEQQIKQNIQNQDLKLFYKVKLFLSEVYLLFVRKSYKQNQIYHYFDRNSNGTLLYDQFLHALTELNATFDEQLSKKVLNYLDKNRQKIIRVPLLVIELQNCLSSKLRLILQTKTSKLFKEKAQVFAEKSLYFIDQLSTKEQFVEIAGVNKSCILEHNFISLLKDFGCLLSQDQLQDIRQNFQAIQGFLLLYPIYTTFMGLFKDSTNQNIQVAEAQRYRKLLLGLIRHNFTIQQLSKLGNYSQLYNFIEQLGQFTPVDIRLIIQSCLYEGSKAIDIDLLKNKIKNAFLTKENVLISESFVKFAQLTHEDTKEQLKNAINIQLFIKTLGANIGSISFQTFEEILEKMRVFITKGTAKKYFDLFAQGHQRLEISSLVKLSQPVENMMMQKTSMSLFQSVIPNQNEQERIDQSKLINEPTIKISEHIIKSLNFRRISLDREFEKYYESNYGFVSVQKFEQFLRQIGIIIDPKLGNKEVEIFLEQYSQIYKRGPFNSNALLKTDQLQQMIIEASRCFVPFQQKYSPNYYRISCSSVQSWIRQSEVKWTDIENWLHERGLQEYSLQNLFYFLCQKYPNDRQTFQLLLKKIPSYIKSFVQFFAWLEDIKQQLSPNQKQAQIQKAQQNISLPTKNGDYYLMFSMKNPINIYQHSINSFCNLKPYPQGGHTNIQRIAANLLYQQILSHKYLLEMSPNLIQPQSQTDSTQLKISLMEPIINMKAVSNFTIDQQKSIDLNGMLLVNNKYYGLSTSLKVEFQNMASLSCSLDPSAIFYKTRNLYLWQPNSEFMPKTAINYRWKYIPNFAKTILIQLANIHSLGFCVPHLRWQHLNYTKFIDKVPYPSNIDQKGIIKAVIGLESISFEDSYCCPQFYRGISQQKLSFKCDSWIFGCLLYQFIYGHQPSSFLKQLQQYSQERTKGITVAQLLQMEELPSEFGYLFYNSQKISSTLTLQHQLKCRLKQSLHLSDAVKRQQSFRGLLACLQILYGDEYRYYKQEFVIMEELNNIIYQCLNPDHQQRPSIEDLLTRGIFRQQNKLQQYKLILNNHINGQTFYSQIIQPVIQTFSSLKFDFKLVSNILKKLNNSINILINHKNVDSQYIIPKYYPWPSNSGRYSEQILKMKQTIKQTSNFNILALFYNSHFIEMVTFIAIICNNQQKEYLLQELISLLTRLLINFKEYNNASCAFVSILIDTLLKIIYDEPIGMISHSWMEDLDISSDCMASLSRIVSQNRKTNYLKFHNFSQVNIKRSLNLLRQITYLTGQGSSQYLPIRHYLMQNQKPRQLLQIIHCHIKLMAESQQQLMMINYFRDRMMDLQKFRLQLSIRVQVDLMIFLTARNESKANVLLYFKEALISHPTHLSLFKYAPIYLYLNAILRNTLESIPIKQIVLEIISQVISYPIYCKNLSAASTNICRQLVRMMVEPANHLAAKNEYNELKKFLLPIARVFIDTAWGRDVLMSLDAGSTIVEMFVEKEDMKLLEASVISM